MKLPFLAVLICGAGFVQTITGQAMTDQAASRFLDQATWGPTPAAIQQLQQMGINAWLAQQFALNTSDLPDQPILASDGTPNKDLTPVERAFFQNAITSQDQLRQRVAFVLSQIWVVSQTSGVQYAYAFPPYWRIFRDNAFGNYRDLIKAVTLNPAMGRYLNMANNAKANPTKDTAPNENYARELMQLFTLGLTQLNPDGSAVMQNGQPVATFSGAVVPNTAKALTGWTYPTAPGAEPKASNPAYFFGQMFAVESRHDTTAKTTVANAMIPAGQTAEQDLESVLDTLMAQPTMAPFVSRQLIQHLVTSNPSPQYIQRVSSVFTDDGTGVRGNLQAVITAILTDPEARAGDDPNAVVSASFGHMREPILFMTSMLRGLNATLGPRSTIYSNASFLGENLFHEPSVFSYFSPQYRIAGGLLGPEFQIYSTQTAANRANIVYQALYGSLDSSTAVSLAPFVTVANDPPGLVNYLSYAFLHHAMSGALQQAVTDAVNGAGSAPVARARAALYVTLTSGEYQIVR